MSTLRLMAIDAICQRGSVRDSDVATLRRTFAHEPHISASDVDALFRAHNLARVRDPSWADFFIETLTDYVVRELEPEGYVTATHAGWLIARISNAGRIRSKTEHDLLLNIIDKARWVPESLQAFALTQIRDAVTTGEGPLRTGSAVSPGTINLVEVEQIRALLFAYGNEGPRAITQTEAELMIDIEQALTAHIEEPSTHRATATIDPWPVDSWRDLLGKAIANAILSASGYTGPSREEALNEAIPLRQTHRTAGVTYQGGLLANYRRLQTEERALQRLELQRVEIITGETVASADANRLAHRLQSPALARSLLARSVAELQSCGFQIAAPLSVRTTLSAVFAA
jgi:hypothetical protein